MSDLVPCPRCGRHVRVWETGCPFCACALAEQQKAGPAAARPRGRMSRAALLTAGAALLSAAACDENVAVPVYGAPAPDASADIADANQSDDTSFPADSLIQLDTGGVSDAAASDRGQVVIYGAPALPSE